MVKREAFKNLKLCMNCAHPDHAIENCREDFEECEYPHDGETFGPHSILMCPVLHHPCDLCVSVGHLPQVHYKEELRQPQYLLRKRFFEFMPFGYWTSIPLLAIDPETRTKINDKHFRFAYESANFRKSSITRYALGLENIEVIGVKHENDVRTVRENWREEEEARRLEFNKRIQATQLSDFQPLDRQFYTEERTEKRKRRIQSILEARKAQRVLQTQN
jgi:hypothetical protein